MRIAEARRTGATVLDISRLSLTTLPREISSLTALQMLYLHDNLLAALPPEIGSFTALQKLDLSNNALSALQAEIGLLAEMRVLDVSSNWIRRLPPEIGSLTALQTLILTNNRLAELPPEIRSLPALRRLHLDGNPGLGLPTEVLGPTSHEVDRGMPPAPPAAIFDYYFARRSGVTRRLNEVRLVLVGPGYVGKTSMVDRLVRDEFVPGRTETLGVELCDWRMTGCPRGAVLAHVWDFAGQTITHAMHQFFLSARTAYVLVLTGRGNLEREDAEYWLRLIAAFGTDEEGKGPPVIVALNKWDDPGSAHAKLDRNALRERYPFIVGFVETDCKTKTGVPDILKLLHETVDRLPWVRAEFPDSYHRVKERLRAVKDPHLPYDQYRQISRDCGVEDEARQDNLARNLHALGVALNFRDDERLRFASVLKPAWLTEHVYALVRHAERHDGLLREEDLPAVLKDEQDPKIRRFLVEMMSRFEIAYPLAEDGAAAATQWLVPQALPDSQPDGVAELSRAAGATRLRFGYRALPETLVPRFIVRTHPFIEGAMRWKSGVVLTKDGARALVRADFAERQVGVTVTGPDEPRRELAGLARQEFRTIHASVRGLNVTEETEVRPGEWVPLVTLERDEKAKRATGVATDAGTVQVNPTGPLNAFSAPAARDESWKPRVFISYSQHDEPQRRKLELYLKVLATHGVVHEKWDDRCLQPGDDWDRSIKSEMDAADVIVVLLSEAALATDYIRSVEITRALERHARGEAVVVPVILEYCHWTMNDLRHLAALPTKAKPVRDWRPHRDGWMDVSNGLKRIFERLRSEHGR